MVISRRHLLRLTAAFAFATLSHGAPAAAEPKVALKTNMGEIVLELYPEKAPKTVANFMQYVKSGHYNGTIFHRVIDGFMIQGGGYDKNLKERPTKKPIQNEAANALKNEAYTIAMARTSDPHSATSQFFINVVDNAKLDYPGRDGWGYAVFGKVIKGMEVVDKIKTLETQPKGEHMNVPVTPAIVESATIVK